MINEVCHKIKEKRRVLGYSIENVVEKTKLHPTVIEDIENNNFANISPTYIKGFIRIYASFLEVDLGDSLEEIEPLKPAPKAVNVRKDKDKDKDKDEGIVSQKESIFQSIRKKVEQVPSEVKKKIILVFAGIVLLWALFSVVKLTVIKISSTFKKDVKTAETIKQQVIPPPVEEIEGVGVALTAKKRCFLRVTVDGKVLFEGILEKGSVETWKGDKEIELRISDGSAIHLEVNGRPIPILASIRKPIKSLKITSSGISVDK